VASSRGVVYRGPAEVAAKILLGSAPAQVQARWLTELDNFRLRKAISRLARANDTCAAFAVHVARRRFSHALARSGSTSPCADVRWTRHAIAPYSENASPL